MTAIRGRFLTHAIAMESAVDALLITLYLPLDASVEYQFRFKNHLLGSRGLSFDGKVSALLGAAMGDEVISPILSDLAKKIRATINLRNAIAHADYDSMVAFTPREGDPDSEVDLNTATFYLNVVSNSGLPKNTPVSAAKIDEWIEADRPVIAELGRLMVQLRGWGE